MNVKRQFSKQINNIYQKLRVGASHFGYHSRPSFLIIGAQKSGTSALSNYLSKHPSIRSACKKEIHFFDRDIAHARGYAWYHSHFPLPYEIQRGAITFEATPSYLYRSKSARRIYEYESNIKLIIVLRNPVDRAYSQWNMYRIHLSQNPQYLYNFTRDSDTNVRQWVDKILASESFHDFDEAIEEELDIIFAGNSTPEPSYLRRGMYHQQINRYLMYFDLERIQVIDSRSLMHRPVSILNQVTQFLGLPSFNWLSQEFSLVHARPYQREISEKIRLLLQKFYRPHNERLYELLGCNFGWK
jgi:hypothetical protein